MEPSAKITVSGTPGQPGHQYVWEGDETGVGQMVIKTAEPYKSIDEELKFIKPMEAVSDILFTMEPADNGIKVNWIMSGENKSTMDKWMGLCMDALMGKDFENGLKDLKELSEK
jgi:hypothetical protein